MALLPSVTFDVWHTLVYMEPEAEEEYYHTQVSLAVEALRGGDRVPGTPSLNDAELAKVFERTLRAATREAEGGRTVTPAEQIVRAGRETGRTPAVDLYLERLRRAVNAQPFQPAPGAREVMRTLHDEGYRIGIVGNTVGEQGRALREVLHRLELDRHVRSFVFSDEHPWAKPAPEIFWEAMERLGEQRERAVHVGDAWADIEGARRAGLRGSVLFTGLHNYGPHYRSMNVPHEGDLSADRTVSRLVELPPLLPGILGP